MKIKLITRSLLLVLFISSALQETVKWVDKECSAGDWCLSCDITQGKCKSCHHKAYSTADATLPGYYTCTQRTLLVDNCREYTSGILDDGICTMCDQGFNLATNKTWCENFTGQTTPCGNWCLSCPVTASAPKYGACDFCFPDFVVDTAVDNSICGEANTTAGLTGLYKCKFQKDTSNCLECKVGFALNYAGTSCTDSTNLKCGKLFEDTTEECYECHYGYIMINNQTCLLNSNILNFKIWFNLILIVYVAFVFMVSN